MKLNSLCAKSLLSASLVTLLGAAQAGTMGPVGPNWTGFYVGVNGGGAWGKADYDWDIPVASTINRVVVNPVVVNARAEFDRSSFIGGGQIGVNYQVRAFVLGLEGDFDYLNLNADRMVTVQAAQVTSAQLNQHFSTDWLSTVRGRIGYTSNQWLLYGTAGAAFANIKYDNNVTFTNNNVLGNSYPALSNNVETGWTAGAGLEWQFATHWSAKVEYMYFDFANLTNTGIRISPEGVVTPDAFVNYNHHLTANIARVGVNYMWG